MIKVVMIIHNHVDSLKRKRSFSWLLIAREQRKLRKRLHSKRKIPQSKRETENLTHANRVSSVKCRILQHTFSKYQLFFEKLFKYNRKKKRRDLAVHKGCFSYNRRYPFDRLHRLQLPRRSGATQAIGSDKGDLI